MARQGRLCQQIEFFMRCCFNATALRSLCIVWMLQVTAVPAFGVAPELADVRVDLKWETPSPVYCRITLDVEDRAGPIPSINEVTDASESGDLSSSVELSKNEVQVRPRLQIQEGHLRLHLVGAKDAKLSVSLAVADQLADLNSANAMQHQLTLSELIQTDGERFEAESGISFSITRIEHDALRLENASKTVFFQPSSELNYDFKANGLHEAKSSQMVMEYSLVRFSDREVIFSQRAPLPIDSSGNSPSVAIKGATDWPTWRLRTAL